MSSIEELRKEREKKARLLEEHGMDPYASNTERTHTLQEIAASFEELANAGQAVVVDGRVMALRSHGSSAFVDINDGTETFQIFLKEDELGEGFNLFEDTVDVGDIIEVRGGLFETRTGQPSVRAESWRMLTKSLLPLPEQWYGFEDEEKRLRKRYIDILMNDDVRDMVEKKARFWQSLRSFVEEKGFIEVQTPTLELTTGGAEATPFKTHHNDFDMDVFLRISVGELWQKRLMAAGIPSTYEIGRVYRNEGSSPEHLQEFRNLELYSAYTNFEDGKQLTIDMYRHVAEEVFGTTAFETRGHSFDLSDEWEELDYVSTIEDMTGVNVLEASEEELRGALEERSVAYEGDNRERLTDSLWKYCRRQVSGPALLVNHPKLVAPLSMPHPENSQLTQTFQVILAGSELGRAHAELNDPHDQRQRFDKQKELLEEGDTEAMMPDWEYVEMLEHGMPPTFGLGFGERLFAYLADVTMREATIFPLLKPKSDN